MASSSTPSSSSLSTLSAKARPFVPPQPRPSPLLPSSSQSTLSAKAPPFAKRSSDPASKINPLIGTPYYPSYDGFFGSELLGLDGFPSSTYSGDDVLESSWHFEDFHGVTVGPWNAPLDGEVWQLEESDVSSSLWRIPSLDHGGVRPKVTAPHKISVASKSALSSQISEASTSAVLSHISWASTSAVSSQISGASSGAVSSQLSISSPPVESCNAFQLKSSPDHYTEKVYTCSTNPVANYPVLGHSMPAPVHDPSAQETSSIADSKTVDSTRAVPEEWSTSQKVKGEEGFDGRRTANNNINTDTDIDGDSSIMKKGMSSSSGYETSLTSPIKLPKTLSSRSDSAKRDKSLRNSSAFEDLDLDVDSPCWRGTLTYQQSPFHVDEAITPHLTAVTSTSDTEVAGSQPYIPTTSGYAKTIHYLEKSEDLISDVTKSISSISRSEKSLDVAFSSLQKRYEYPYIIESERNCKGIPFLVNSEVERTDMTKDKQRKSESQDKEALQLDQEVTVTSPNQSRTAYDITVPEYYLKDTVQNSAARNQCCAVDVTTSITVESHDSAVLSGKLSFAGEYTQLIDEMLQCLREKLLSHAYKDENALKELLNDVLLLVNDYPETFVLNNKKGITNVCCTDSGQVADRSQRGLKSHDQVIINQSGINNIEDIVGKEEDAILYQSNIKTCHGTGVQEKMQPIGPHITRRQGIAQGNSHDCGWEFARSQIIGLPGEAFRQSNITISHDMMEKFARSIGDSMSDQIDNLPSDLSVIEGMADDFKKILNKTFCEREENLRTVLHKNLWIEAQVKLFSMKYELQLARTEIEILKHNLYAKGSLQEATRLSRLNYWQNSQASKPLIDIGEGSQKFHQDMNKREKDDPSRMAGLGVLEGQRTVGQICRQDAARVFAKCCLGAHEYSRS